MQGTAGNEWGRTRSVGLSKVFFQMSPEFREAVVKRALTWRDRVSSDARDSLNRAIGKHVVVDGFRNAGMAPAAMVSVRVAEQTTSADDLAGSVLLAWYESQDQLRENAAEHLERLGVPIGKLDCSEGRINAGMSDHPLIEAVANFVEERPEADREETKLAMELMTGTFLMDGDDAGDGQVSSVLEAALEALKRLPANSDSWEEVIPGYVEGVAEIIEQKKAERALAGTLDNLFAEICEEYGGLTEFFQWNAERWLVANLLPGIALQEPHVLATELKGLLSKYRPIHERAAVASEEMGRAKERLKLMPGILEAGNSLDGLMERYDGPEGGAVRVMPSAGQGPNFVPNGTGEHNGSGDQIHAATNTIPTREDSFGEVPPCQIEDYLLMRLEIQELDKENDDLERQVKTLKEQLYETRSVGEGLRLALAFKEDGSVEEVEFPILEDVKAVVELATERFQDRLLFQCNAESTIEDNPFKWPEQVWKALEWLATSYYESRTGASTNPDLDVSCREASGMWYKTSQHDNTMAQYRNAYTTRVDRRIIWLGEHIGKGTGFDPRRTIRIGFDWDRTLQKVIIGYIGRHQTTSAS